jgi:uncharacterized protein YaiL (DUF2058 family)
MGSLQEQLLNAGLVNKSKAHKVKKEKQKHAKTSRHAGAGVDNRKKSAAHKEQARRADRDRELNRQKQKQVEQKAVMAQIKQLIELNKLDRGQGDIAYSFVYKNKVKKIFVSDDVKRRLGQGRLAIVRLVLSNETLFEIVAAEVAAMIAQRDENTVVQLSDNANSVADENDEYADYKVPDDLTW